ncbi:MAG: tetratricopeptide repeat protein [Rickettsiales bacterium]|nr:tetratricopeptide repeat protein [Rickettsiales bacterium]
MALAGLFDNIPLGLSQSVAYIVNRQKSIKSYIEEYTFKKEEGLPICLQDATNEIEAGHRVNIYATMLMTLDSLSPEAISILRTCSYLHANAIPISLFHDLFSEEQKTTAIAILHGYSLISIKIEEDVLLIDIHRLIQEVTRTTIEGDLPLKQTVILLNNNMISGIDRNEILSNGKLLNHANTLVQNIIFAKQGYNLFIELAYLNDKIGHYYEIIEFNLNSALEFYKKALEIKQNVHNSQDHFEIAESLTNIGRIYWKQGNSEWGVQKHLEALEVVKNTVYPEQVHIKIAEALSNLGRVYLAAGKMLVSLDYLEQSHNIYEQLNLEEEAYADILHNLANTYERTGNLELFKEYCGKTLKLKKIIYTHNHPSIALSLNNYGYSLCILKHINEGIQFLEKALAIYKTLHEDNNHPDTARTLNNLGYYYIKIGKYKKGTQYQKLSLKMREELYGSKHPAIAASLIKLGKASHDMGDYKSSLEFHKKALDMRRSLFPNKNHPDIAESLCYLAYSLKVMGGINNIKTCLVMLDQSIKMMKSLYPTGHPLIIKYSNLIEFDLYTALDVTRTIADKVSTYTYSDCHHLQFIMIKKLWDHNTIYLIEGFLNELGNVPDNILGTNIIEYFYSRDDLAVWLLDSKIDYEQDIPISIEPEYKKINQQNIKLLTSFALKEAIEAAPLIKYFLEEMLHLPSIELPKILSNNYLWIVMHYAVCNIDTFSVLGSFKLTSSLTPSLYYANKILIYEYISDSRQEHFQNTENKSISSPMDFIEKCGPDILSQTLIVVTNNGILFTPTIYDITISAAVGGMQCYQQYKQQTENQMKEQSFAQITITFIADAAAGISTGCALLQSNPIDITSLLGQMMLIKQSFVVMSSVVITDYMTKLVLATYEELVPENITQFLDETYKYFLGESDYLEPLN